MELKNLQVGDKLTVEMVVSQISNYTSRTIFVKFSDKSMGNATELCVFRDGSSIIAHTPKPIEVKVGTHFRSGEGACACTVVQVEGENAAYTFKSLNGTLQANTYPLTSIRRFLEKFPVEQSV